MLAKFKHLIGKQYDLHSRQVLQDKVPTHDNHRLLSYHNNGFLQYNYHTIVRIIGVLIF